jgi:hypothetical protein
MGKTEAISSKARDETWVSPPLLSNIVTEFLARTIKQ